MNQPLLTEIRVRQGKCQVHLYQAARNRLLGTKDVFTEVIGHVPDDYKYLHLVQQAYEALDNVLSAWEVRHEEPNLEANQNGPT